MVTVAILAVGIVMIYKALLLSLNRQDHLMHRLYAMNLLDHKVTVLHRDYRKTEDFPLGQSEEIHRVLLNNKPLAFRFMIDFNEIGDLEDILQLDLTLSWRERRREIRLSRSTYVFRF